MSHSKVLTEQDVLALPIVALIPHDYPMVFVDRVLLYDTSSIEVEVLISNKPLLHNGLLSSWTGVEMMAQTIAALGGIRHKLSAQAIRVGFLVSARKFKAVVPAFEEGMRLRIIAHEVLVSSDGLAVFDCEIYDRDNETGPLVSATIHVFQPQNIPAQSSH